MPQIRYNGPSFYGRCADPTAADFTRGEVREVSQDWLDQWRRTIGEPKFSILGDEGITVDAGNDGIPDSGWKRGDILAWLADNGVTPTGAYVTKSGLLTLVDEVLNPTVDAVEEEVQEVVEEVTNEIEQTTETETGE